LHTRPACAASIAFEARHCTGRVGRGIANPRLFFTDRNCLGSVAFELFDEIAPKTSPGPAFGGIGAELCEGSSL
jgi:hypothetical protein